MPRRLVPLITGHYYHIFNRGVERRIIFTTKREYRHMLDTIRFYKFYTPNLRLSRFLDLSLEDREKVKSEILTHSRLLVKIISFCLMPNHFHFLLRQEVDSGISKFLKNVSDSYTRYFNTRNDRVGPLYQGQFKSVLIESEQQLLHVSRYIHLNPYSSLVVKEIKEILEYPWSSLREYILGIEDICDQGLILDHFQERQKYKIFVFNQADHQRRLQNIKHLLLE